MSADVTVVMPAMNRAHLIGPSLDSIRAQTVRPHDVIVVDDASGDDTVRVAREHEASVIELPENGGSGPARNRGIRAATTTWIAFLDSDDLWAPHHLERLLEHATDTYHLLTAPAVATGGRLIGNCLNAEQRLTPRRALSADIICTSGTMARRQTLIDAGLFRPFRRAQDMDMWVRVLERGPGLALCVPGVTYTLHDQQAIHDSDLSRACFDQIVEDRSGTPWFTWADRDRAYTTRTWDDARSAQSSAHYGSMARDLGWIASRPHTWSTLAYTLRQRRSARLRQAELQRSDRSGS